MTIRVALALSAIALTGCDLEDFAGSNRYKSDFHYSYDLNPGARIDAESFNGSIEITGDDQNKIEIEGTKYGATEQLRDAIRIDIAPAPDSITIRAEHPPGMPGNMGARFTIHAPRSAIVDRIATSNGALRVIDMAGDGRFRTSNGAIHVQNLRGAVDAQTSNGAIEISGTRGDAVLRTSNGRITGDGINGTVEGATSNGAIRVQLDHSPATPVKLETSNGPIELRMLDRPKADVRAATSNGAITLQLPSDTAARISARTSNSAINTDFSISVHGEISKNHLEGDIGGGGPTLVLRTNNGHIRIVKGAVE